MRRASAWPGARRSSGPACTARIARLAPRPTPACHRPWPGCRAPSRTGLRDLVHRSLPAASRIPRGVKQPRRFDSFRQAALPICPRSDARHRSGRRRARAPHGLRAAAPSLRPARPCRRRSRSARCRAWALAAQRGRLPADARRPMRRAFSPLSLQAAPEAAELMETRHRIGRRTPIHPRAETDGPQSMHKARSGLGLRMVPERPAASPRALQAVQA